MQTSSGKKFDADKADLTLLEGIGGALQEVAKVLMFGEKKYSRDSWQNVPNGQQRYKAAAMRHALAPLGSLDSESGLLHAAHEACSILFAIQLKLNQIRDSEVAGTLPYTHGWQRHEYKPKPPVGMRHDSTIETEFSLDGGITFSMVVTNTPKHQIWARVKRWRYLHGE